MFPETKFFVIVLVMFLFPEQDVEHLNSYHHWKILKNSSLAPWLNRYKRKKWSHDTGLREIQAVSELYHNKGAAAGAAFRLLRRFFALVGVAGCAWRSSKKVNKCLWKQEGEDWKRTQEILTMVHGKRGKCQVSSLLSVQGGETNTGRGVGDAPCQQVTGSAIRASFSRCWLPQPGNGR